MQHLCTPAIPANVEKRAYDRQSCTAPVVVSKFNKKHCFDAQMVNCCQTGMCIRSKHLIQPGMAVYIRALEISPNGGSCSEICKDFRAVSLAEVKWCRQIDFVKDFPYEIGLKYFEPGY